MKRIKDINVQKLVYVHIRGEERPIQIEAYGENLDGEPVWILLHMAPNTETHITLATSGEED